MKPQLFKNYMSYLHESWLAAELGMRVNLSPGVDVIDERKGLEVKSCLVNPKSQDYGERYYKWTPFDGQWNFPAHYTIPLFWALGVYQMDSKPRRIQSTKPKILEQHVTEREFWIVSWEWANQFPVCRGIHHTYKYLNPNPCKKRGLSPIPRTIHKKAAAKGVIHFTEGVDLRLFDNVL